MTAHEEQIQQPRDQSSLSYPSNGQPRKKPIALKRQQNYQQHEKQNNEHFVESRNYKNVKLTSNDVTRDAKYYNSKLKKVVQPTSPEVDAYMKIDLNLDLSKESSEGSLNNPQRKSKFEKYMER